MADYLHFAFLGPNYRSERRVVEFHVDVRKDEPGPGAPPIESLRQLLLTVGILSADEQFPAVQLPEDPWQARVLLAAQLALLFQRKAGHRVSLTGLVESPIPGQFIALAEHEHPDVGNAAGKLALECVTGERTELEPAWSQFRSFAQERVLPIGVEAIIKAAMERDIPCYPLDRFPFTGKTGLPFRICPNGLLHLGHGRKRLRLEGSFCHEHANDMHRALLRNPGQRQAFLNRVGAPRTQVNPTLILYRIHGQNFALQSPGDGQPNEAVEAPKAFLEVAQSLCELLGVAVISLDISLGDADEQPGVADFSLAPDLDALDGCGDLLQQAAGALVEGLFPDPGASRMPVIAITGTNGKTTTTRMVNAILKTAGRHTAMVMSDGIVLDKQVEISSDAGTLVGHSVALTHATVDVAVLESHHRGIAIRGSADQWTDVGVCLNVTEDHLSPRGIRTVDQMADVKRAVVERARYAAVLNADDPRCLAMAEGLSARTLALVSLQNDVEALRRQVGERDHCFAVLEIENEEEWVVIHRGDRRLPLIRVNDIPATMNGAARFNVSNAMHAALAALLIGTPVEALQQALSTFQNDAENTPGRLNVFNELPFQVIMDFAHNPGGMAQIARMADRMNVEGRKLVAFATSRGRTLEFCNQLGKALAGHFDVYFCKEYAPKPGQAETQLAPTLQASLMSEGVSESQTRVMTHGRDVIFSIFDECRPGDVIFMLMGHVEKDQLPGYIREYAARP